jgi:transcriptional regulator with XRE-family HTH domain
MKKISEILKDKNLSLRDLEQIIDYPRGSLSLMINGKRPFSDEAREKLLPILEVSEEDFAIWIIADKYSKALIGKALHAFESREDKKKPVLTQNLDKILAEKNLSRTNAATAIKYSQSGLNRMIIGQISMSKPVMQKLSDFLAIPLEDLQAWALADNYPPKLLEKALNLPE